MHWHLLHVHTCSGPVKSILFHQDPPQPLALTTSLSTLLRSSLSFAGMEWLCHSYHCCLAGYPWDCSSVCLSVSISVYLCLSVCAHTQMHAYCWRLNPQHVSCQAHALPLPWALCPHVSCDPGNHVTLMFISSTLSSLSTGLLFPWWRCQWSYDRNAHRRNVDDASLGGGDILHMSKLIINSDVL